MNATQDRLFLLKQGFESPDYPGQRFFCWHCALLDGLLLTYPELTRKLSVERIEWSGPRKKIIALVGENNQSLPLLLLPQGETSVHQTGVFDGRSFISDKDAILQLLAERHGFPRLFPG
ncbi:DUF3088 domain-containing protein [Brucella gallinifaecis]|uniref:DUF3088 domain-containing protein n=1 Tax=Brucella gallinifaecis TaxID=215590 RepID=UPI002362D447|nr:DUF3088 domain-containing protein [Brucella gallinifaecis]